MIHAICCVDDFGFEDKKQSVPHILNALYKSNIFHHESKSISIGAGRELFPKILCIVQELCCQACISSSNKALLFNARLTP